MGRQNYKKKFYLGFRDILPGIGVPPLENDVLFQLCIVLIVHCSTFGANQSNAASTCEYLYHYYVFLHQRYISKVGFSKYFTLSNVREKK